MMDPDTMVEERTPRQPVTDRAQAAELCGELQDTVSKLSDLLARETLLLKEIRPREIAPLQEEKTALTQAYLGQFTRFKANAAFIGQQAPAHVNNLRRDHASFQNILEDNLTALEAARAANHGVIEAVFEIVQERDAGPTVYGNNANLATAYSNKPTAIAVDRTL